jgi:hypothetical protein
MSEIPHTRALKSGAKSNNFLLNKCPRKAGRVLGRSSERRHWECFWLGEEYYLKSRGAPIAILRRFVKIGIQMEFAGEQIFFNAYPD